ncbi:MAG: DUF169 domain-containing protein [Candidatus Methylomirabilales bacterium]
MGWRTRLAELVERLALQRQPVAVRYVASPPPAPRGGAPEPCEALLRASQGETVILASDGACALGSHYLGLDRLSPEQGRRAFEDFVFDQRRSACFIEEVPGADSTTVPPPARQGSLVILSPVRDLEDPPDVLLFICGFEQACQLIALDVPETGAPARMEMRGPTCHRAIGYPLVTGRLNVSLMSHVGRRLHGFRADDVLVSVPGARLLRMLDRATRGEGPGLQIPAALRSMLQERCRGSQN